MTTDAHLQPSAPGGRAEPILALRKTWRDTEPGISMVQIQYAWTPTGDDPDWDSAAETVLLRIPDAWGLRTAVLEVPRFVSGSPNFTLHHFFFIIRGTDRIATQHYSEDIVAREVVYEDPDGDYTTVGVSWEQVEESPDLPPLPNYTVAAMDGLSFTSSGADAPPEPASIYDFVRAQPLPHVFRALVWGVRGSQVRYTFHLQRAGSADPADDGDEWSDNGGSGWRVEL